MIALLESRLDSTLNSNGAGGAGRRPIPMPDRDRRSLHAGIGRLAAAGAPVKLSPGETLHVEDEPAENCYEVLSGLLKEFNTLSDGRRHVAGFCLPGAFVGLSPMPVYQHTVEAIEECRLLRYPRRTFDAIVSDTPELAQLLLQQVMRRLARVQQRMLALSRLAAVERVGQFLLELAEETQSPCGEIRIQMSRQDMADHLGLTTETVCRALTRLKRENLIRMPSPHRVSLASPNKLRAMIERDDPIAPLCAA